MRKVCIIVIAVLTLFITNSYAFFSDEPLGYVPQPKLKEPQGYYLYLSGKDEVVFSWGKHVGVRALGKYYDFRIYRGSELELSNLIFKERVPGNKYDVRVLSNLFDDKGVYTWSLRLGYRILGKSRRSFNTFQVIK